MTQFSEFWEAGAQERLNTMFGEAITFTRAGVDYAVTARVQRSSAGDFEGDGLEGFEAEAMVTFAVGDVTGLAADPASEVSRYGVKIPVVVGSSTTQSMIAGRRVDHAGGDVSFYLRRKKPSQMVSHGQKE